MVNVTIYSIHGSYMGYGKYGNEKSIKKKPTSSAGSQLRSTPWILQGLPAAEQRYVALLTVQWLQYGSIPIGSMYAIYGNIYHQYTPNVGINTIHGSYGIWFNMVQGLPRLNWASFFTSLTEIIPQHLPCILGEKSKAGILALLVVILDRSRKCCWNSKKQRMLHGFAKVLDLLTLFFMVLDLLTLFLHGSGSDLET